MKKYAFLVHPIASVKEDLARAFWLFNLIPEFAIRFGIKRIPPFVGGEIRIKGDNNILGWIIMIPVAPSDFFRPQAYKFAMHRIYQAIQKAKALGAEIVGLGALTSSVSHSGQDLINKVDGVTIVTGSPLTAGVTVQAVEKACHEIRGVSLKGQTVAIIGATGSVGSCVAQLMAEKGAELILAARNRRNLETAQRFLGTLTKVSVASDLSELQRAGVVVVATSAVNQILQPSYLAQNALVYDITQPRNTSALILKSRPDVTIIDGGVISTPKIDWGMNIRLAKDQAYACLVETMIMAIEGKTENHVGPADPDTAREMLGLMEKHSALFEIAPFQSFGTQRFSTTQANLLGARL